MEIHLSERCVLCAISENPCILYCENDEGAVASLLPRVIDGTSCQRGIRDICIDGLCKVSS